MRVGSFFIRDGRLRPGWRVPVYLLVLALTYLVITLPATIFQLHYGYQQLLQLLAVLVATWLCRRFVDKRDWASFGLRLDRQGLRDIGLWGLNPDEVRAAFPEFSALAENCRFDNCRHLEEPGCVVLKALEEGDLAQSRHISYRQLLEEAERAARPWLR